MRKTAWEGEYESALELGKVRGEDSKLTAMVLIPVRSVTVADPPSTSMAETMIFVAILHAYERVI